MSFGLLLPAALATLAALLLPLLIHLARRSEQRLTRFAALRWLRQRPRPRQRVRFDEWPLLLLRLLLLALVALWLARPVLHGEQAQTPWFVAIPGVDPAQVWDVAGDRGEVRWLAPGFPAIAPGIGQPASQQPQPFASLLRQLDAELPADVALTVFAPERLGNADAQVPVLSRQVDWQVLPGAMPEPSVTEAVPPPLRVVFDGSRASAVRYLRAAARAWQPDEAGASAGVTVVALEQARMPEEGVLVWLAPGDLPAAALDWIEGGGTALLDAEAGFSTPSTMTVAWRDERGVPLMESALLGRGRVLRLTRPLSPAAMPQLLEPGFPDRLRELLAPPLPPARVEARAHAPRTGGASYPQPPRELQPWWALLVVLVLLVERWLGTSRRRGVAS